MSEPMGDPLYAQMAELLTAVAFEIDHRLGPITGKRADQIAVAFRGAADAITSLAAKLSQTLRERDEARAQAKFDRETLQAREMLGGALGMDMNECVVEATKRVCKQYERERDEARNVLASIRPYLVMVQTSKGLQAAHLYIEAIDTALLASSSTKGKG